MPAGTCNRTGDSTGGRRGDFMVGCPLAPAAVSNCRVELGGWIVPHFAVRTIFACHRWTCKATQPIQRTLLWPASWLTAVDKSRGSKSVEVQRVWEIYDDRLQFMSRADATLLDESVNNGDVSFAWLVWSGAAENALADAYGFAGGSVPGTARFRVVRLGGPKVRKVRPCAADVHEAGDVFMYRDLSIAPLLDVRRRIKAVMD